VALIKNLQEKAVADAQPSLPSGRPLNDGIQCLPFFFMSSLALSDRGLWSGLLGFPRG